MTNKIINIKNLDDSIKFSKDLASKLKPNDKVLLYGDLGVGKTVVAKEICNYFKVNKNITSPTFTLLKSYDVDSKSIKHIYHFDLYRIKSIEELFDIGFEEYLYIDNSILIIEWPEIAENFFSDNVIKIYIEKSNNEFERLIRIENDQKH